MNDNIWGKIGSFLMRAVIAVFGDKEEHEGLADEKSSGMDRYVFLGTKWGLKSVIATERENVGYTVDIGTDVFGAIGSIILLSGGKIYGSPILEDGTPKYTKWIKANGWTGDEVLLDSVSDGNSLPMAEGGVITGGNPDSVFSTSAGNWKADELPKDYKDEAMTNETINR